jgi:hypothetical protein
LAVTQVDLGKFRFDFLLGDAQTVTQHLGHRHGRQVESFALLLQNTNFRLKLPDISLSFPGGTLGLQRQ